MNHFIALFVCLAFAGIVIAQKPWDPAPRSEQWWIERHNSFVKNTRENGQNIDIVFIGSSSIEIWGSAGLEIWNAKYAPLRSVNYGIGGDRTEHVLWRILNGEIDGLRPKMAVIYIGSNNVPSNGNNTEVEMGITAVINTFRQKLPETRLLYLGIFPRGDIAPIVTTFERILAINEEVYRVGHDNVWTNVLNIFWDLAPSMGQLHDHLYQGDKLHLSTPGYQQWDISMNQTFYRLLNA